MKALLSWLVLAILAFGGLAGGYHWHLIENPHKVLVVIDTSFEMRNALPGVPAMLRELEGKRYTRYALETDKSPVHGFAEAFQPSRLGAYAPRDFGRLAERTDGGRFAEADEILLISNASRDELGVLPGWRVLRP